MAESDFAELLRRVRGGDADAAAELVRRYEPMIRLEVRMGLRDTRLKSAFDASDVCQSVLGSFFVRAAAGQFDLNSPSELTGLLVRMARNKLASQARRHTEQCRDVRRQVVADEKLGVAAGTPTPSHIVEMRDLLTRFRERLTDEERRLADWRAQGRSWADIAAELGVTAGAICKQLERAVDRVSAELGLEEG